MKRNFSGLTMEQAMGLIPAENLTPWKIDVGERAPSSVLQTNLSRMKSFMLSSSEAAKLLLIDALLLEVVPNYPALQVWKAAPLKSDTVFGVADYLDYAQTRVS